MTRILHRMISLVCVLLITGCVSQYRQQELLEAKLRQREDQYRVLQNEIHKKDSELRSAREQLAFYQQHPEVCTAACTLPEQSQSLFSIKMVKIDPLHTGFVLQDEDPLHSQLNVVVTPFDDAGEILRVPGTVELQVVDISDSATRELGKWEYDLHETAGSWQRGFFISGFGFLLPITCQENRVVNIISTFTTTDQRVFKASHTVKCTDLLDPMPGKDAQNEKVTPVSNQKSTEPRRLETSVSWEKDVSPVLR